MSLTGTSPLVLHFSAGSILIIIPLLFALTVKIMLGSRTKQVHSYGKRNQRIVNATERDRYTTVPNIFDDMEPPPRMAPIASKMKRRENAVFTKTKTPSPKIVHINRKKRLSPVLSPSKKRVRVAHLIEAEALQRRPTTIKPAPKSKLSPKEKVARTSPRAPLAHFPLNIPGSPAISAAARGRRVPSTTGTPFKSNKPFSPFVDVDIIVLDDEGNTLMQERRISRTDIEANPVNKVIVGQPKDHPALRKRGILPINMVDEDTENIEQCSRPKHLRSRVVRTIYSDDSDSEGEVPPSPNKEFSSRPVPRVSSRTIVEVQVPPAPYRIRPVTKTPLMQINPLPIRGLPSVPSAYTQLHQHFSSPIIRPRPLTPIRRGKSKGLFEPPSPPSPSTLTDFDLSIDFEELSMDAPSHVDKSYRPEVEFPVYLRPLLEECLQETCGPIDFSSFIETFPFDPVAQSSQIRPSDLNFKKIGEASYSEVFGIGDVVLKVVPLMDEAAVNTGFHLRENTRHDEVSQEDGPAPSDAKDVLKEIIVTRAMGEVCDGFVKLLKSYIVRGKYPEVLLRLWDEYHQKKGSESVRPDKFLVSQIYAIIVLPNGGTDLETYKFVNSGRTGWKQACSIFWQVTKSLAHAEQLVSFEHRDLHWGQILIKNLSMHVTPPLRAKNQNFVAQAPSLVPMDDPCHGIQVTLIDLGLSRMDAGDGAGGEMVHWTPFEPEVFMGEGDYQFDVYRIMKYHTNDAWADFKPLTNVMWLHYLALKLLHSKRLKPPITSRNSPSVGSAAFTEKDCYDCLVDIEQWLGACIATIQTKMSVKSTKGKKKTQAPLPTTSINPSCAGEIVTYAVKKGWIKPVS